MKRIALGALLGLVLAGSWTASPVLAQQKTEKACRSEWQANKADNQAKGITEKAYVEQCRSAAASPPATPAAAKPTAPAQAKARCPADTVVWANLKSKIYHFSGHKDYGTTKEGAYMREKDATSQGIRAAKNEKHPA